MKRLLIALPLFIFNGVAATSPATRQKSSATTAISWSARHRNSRHSNSLPPCPFARFHPTVEALQYLLRDSGWSLCLADARRAQLYGLPLPLSQYNTGPLRLKSACNCWRARRGG